MTVQGRDVIFKWFKCCTREIEDEDPVFVTPLGEVRRFDYKARGGANANAQRTLSNIQDILRQMADDRNKIAAILVAIENRMNLSLDPPVPHILNAAQVKRIEAIALPIIRAPIPEPVVPKNSPSHSDAVIEDYWPKTPKKNRLVRSPEMQDLRGEKEFELVEPEHVTPGELPQEEYS